ncbi:hypothetical protein I5168_12985 [Nonlabens sp. SCSIO 43208]|uniref:hypothetical protein n=1 Tax=Nonlabens sp. SCSIO 43208 TaxID=2793009 RepID=UPI003D6C0199
MSSKELTQDEQTIPTIEWEQLIFCLTDSIQDSQANTVVLRSENFYDSRMFTEGYFQSIFHPPKE